MSKYEVTFEAVVYCPVKIVVEAENKDDAIDVASGLISTNVADAMFEKSRGWRAQVVLAPPKGVEVASKEVRAIMIATTSGNERARKLSDPA